MVPIALRLGARPDQAPYTTYLQLVSGVLLCWTGRQVFRIKSHALNHRYSPTTYRKKGICNERNCSPAPCVPWPASGLMASASGARKTRVFTLKDPAKDRHCSHHSAPMMAAGLRLLMKRVFA